MHNTKSENNNNNSHQTTYITFKVGSEEYAADSNNVVSVISSQDLMSENGYTIETSVSLLYERSSSELIDLHDSLNVKKNDANTECNLIITEINKEKVAFLVDEIDDFFYTNEQEGQPLVLKSIKTKGEAVIRNVIYNEKLIQILDFEQLLREKKNKPFRFY